MQSIPEDATFVLAIGKCTTCPGTIDDYKTFPWKLQCADCFRDDSTKRSCTICNKPKIAVSEPAWKKVCGTCFKDSPKGKQCTGCKEYCIKMCEWRTLCQKCYEDKKFARVCTVCEIRPVDDKQPDYIVTCTRCYLAKKKLTHAACPTCPSHLSKMLRRRLTAPACRDCMRSNGQITQKTVEVA